MLSEAVRLFGFESRFLAEPFLVVFFVAIASPAFLSAQRCRCASAMPFRFDLNRKSQAEIFPANDPSVTKCVHAYFSGPAEGPTEQGAFPLDGIPSSRVGPPTKPLIRDNLQRGS